jgi:hypothetical protein
MEEGKAEPPGFYPDLFLLVLIDDVIVARRAVRAGLSKGDGLTGDILKLDGNVLQNVSHPGAFPLDETAHEAARLAVGAGVALEPR